jgi:hypothetical protein
MDSAQPGCGQTVLGEPCLIQPYGHQNRDLPPIGIAEKATVAHRQAGKANAGEKEERLELAPV